MNILICEDNATAALDLWWLLHEQGHWVCGLARTTFDGLERVAQSQPELVMVDEDLGGATRGRDLVEALTRAGFPSVIISSDLATAAWATSARAVLPKPFDEAALTSVLARVGRPLGARETAA